MPLFILNTNLPRHAIPKDFNDHASDLIAKIGKRDKSMILVHVNTDQLMSVGGNTQEPALHGSLSLIHREGPKEEMTKAIYKFLHQQLPTLKSARTIIVFNDLEGSQSAFDGQTLAALEAN